MAAGRREEAVPSLHVGVSQNRTASLGSPAPDYDAEQEDLFWSNYHCSPRTLKL